MPPESKRSHVRVKSKASLFLRAKRDYAGFQKDNYYYTHAWLLNSSRTGIYFEQDYALQPGENICFKISNGPLKTAGQPGAQNTYLARVKWCRRVCGTCEYGIGAQLIEKEKTAHSLISPSQSKR